MGTSPDSIRVIGEKDLLEVARVARSTWQNWSRQGIITPAAEGLHGERDVLEALVVGLLTQAFDLRRTRAVWRLARDDVLAACLALPLDQQATLDAIVDLHTWRTALARDIEELAAALHAQVPYPRGRYVMALAAPVQEARQVFWTRAVPAADFASDKRRRTRRARGATGRGTTDS
jgi:hypothetical protein